MGEREREGGSEERWRGVGNHLLISEDEANALILQAGLAVHDLQISLEVIHIVTSSDDDLEGRVAVDEGRKARERLLAHTADANHERVAAGRLDDAGDAADVAHRILEEHEVHRRVRLVVLIQRAIEQAGEVGKVGDLIVDLVADALGKVAEDERLREEGRRRHLLKELLRLLEG